MLNGGSVSRCREVCCDRDASWYVRRLTAALASTLTESPWRHLAEALADAISAVADKHRTSCQAARPERATPSATVAIARRREGWLDYLVLGEAALLLERGNQIQCVSDRRLSHVSQEIRHRFRSALAGRGSRTHSSESS